MESDILLAEAIRHCAQDLGVPESNLSIIRTDEHYKSRQLYVGHRERGQITHVVKAQAVGWDPQREFEASLQVKGAFADAPHAAGLRLDALTPVGYGMEPLPFMVTRFQEGETLRSRFDAAVRARPDSTVFTEVREYTEVLVAWLLHLRKGRRPKKGLGQDELLEFCRLRIDEIGRFLGASSELKGVNTCLEAYVQEFDENDKERLAAAWPCHGDFSPQNFLLGPAALFGFDLESFRLAPLNDDLAVFRRRLEHYGQRGRHRRARALGLWQVFWDRYTTADSERFALCSYLKPVLAHLAWLRNPERLAKLQAKERIRSRIRDRVWMRGRVAWLTKLTGDVVTDAAHMRNTL